GTQYRSGIYYANDQQKQTALASKEALEKSGAYKKPVVTEIVPFTNFYPAEDYHKEYYDRNSYQPYCQYVIDPKVRKLLKEYRKEVKEEFARELAACPRFIWDMLNVSRDIFSAST